MTDENILEAIKGLLIENVASKFKLEKPPKDEAIDGDFELVNPAVYVGWMPPKSYFDENADTSSIQKYLDQYGHNIPSMIVMLGNGEDDGNETTLEIKVAIITYDPGITGEGVTIATYKGYKDLLNIITKIRIELAKIVTINGQATIQKPIKWGIYEEQNYPYWHGWMTFQASTMPLNYSNLNNDKFL